MWTIRCLFKFDFCANPLPQISHLHQENTLILGDKDSYLLVIQSTENKEQLTFDINLQAVIRTIEEVNKKNDVLGHGSGPRTTSRSDTRYWEYNAIPMLYVYQRLPK